MRKFLLFIFLLPACLFAQDNLLQRFFHTLENRTLTTDFRITISEKANQPLSYNGTLIMRGKCFLLTFSDTQLAFDGTTLYNYNESLNELTLSTPTTDELTQANPFLFAQAIAANCSLTTTEQNAHYLLTLQPDPSTAIQSFTLLLQKSNLLPQRITLTETSLTTTTLQFLNPQFTTTSPTFSIIKEEAYLNDLR